MKLLLLDGHSLAYRAFYALPTTLVTNTGTVTNAVYGFTAMLAKVLADERPDYLAVAFDAPGGSTERFALDPEYKAGRAETPDLFRAQLPLIREVLAALGVTVLEISGVEADDVIATLATQGATHGVDVIVVTGDRDSFQLVEDPHVRVLYNKRGVSDYALYDEAGIVERTGGVTPRQYTDYAALRGDSSDNLPGVPGIGEKTAAKLITAYNDLEGIFEHLDELPPKQRTNLAEFRDRVFTNRTMSVMRRDVECGVAIDRLVAQIPDVDAVRSLFGQLEFRTLLPRILDVLAPAGADDTAAVAFDVAVERIGAASAVVEFLDGLVDAQQSIAVAGDWSGAVGRSDLLGIAVATTATHAHYIDAARFSDPGVAAALDRVAASSVPVVAHRSKELMHGLGGRVFCGLRHDTAVMAYLLDPGEGTYALDALVARHLGIELGAAATNTGQLDFTGDGASDSVGREAAVLLPLAAALADALDGNELVDLYERFELPLIPILLRMELVGVCLDVDALRGYGRELADEARVHEAKIHALADEVFAINSVPQLRRILFEKLGLTPVKKTKTGPSTDADSLQKLAEDHPIVTEILRYREVEKLRSTYADALPPLVAADGRVHANFNQIVAATGRISSEAPNLQNIPIRTDAGKRLRTAFVAAAGSVLMSADYSQIELRILAHLADDPGLVDAFTNGLDVHTVTAAKVFGVDEGAVSPFQRSFAKVVNYGLAYGMEAYGLAQRLDIPTGQAKEMLDDYFASFPKLAAFMQSTVDDARTRGYTVTMFGRRRRLPELASDNFRVRQMGERMAQNAPVQGAAADLFKLAMIACDTALTDGDFSTQMILTVHDELVFEVPDAELEAVRPVLVAAMEQVGDLRVPLVVDVGVGRTWADCK